MLRTRALVILCASQAAACSTVALSSVPETSDSGATGEGTTVATDASTGNDDSESTTGATESTGGGCVPMMDGFVPVAEELTFTTSDGKSIAATLTRPGDATCRPAVVLIHQYQLDRSQWAATTDALVASGYVTLAFDLRGHGDSDPADGALADLLTDPGQAPLDVTAAVDELAASPWVDADRLAVFGTSIGANLAVVAQHADSRIAAAVAFSPRMDRVLALAGGPLALLVGSISCRAGETDTGGQQAQTCTDLAAAANGATDVTIMAGSSAHGVEILELFPASIPETVDWLMTAL